MMQQPDHRLLMAFYGDDFTGSTDALEFLCSAGIKTVLFISPPTVEQLRQYTDIQAVGVAGMSRSLSPMAMEDVLNSAFSALKTLNPRHIHYKVCSTFDSSPTVGSIGKAIEIGAAVFNTPTVPLVVAAPILGRYCLFGNLFARMGIGSEGQIYRLDRHPSMSKHPTTPADESDLRLHLAKQTEKKIGLFDLLALRAYVESKKTIDFNQQDILLFDAIEQHDLQTIGEIIDGWARPEKTLFSVGSSAIEMALGAFWKSRATQSKTEITEWQSFNNEHRILVLSGSCSPITSGQIEFAKESGFNDIAIDTVGLANELTDEGSTNNLIIEKMADRYARLVVSSFAKGNHTILHTSTGNDDIRVGATDQIFKQKGFQQSDTAKFYGRLLGLTAKITKELTQLDRIIVAGGDTSSYAARAMEIEAVEMIAPFSPGAPLCRAHAPGFSTDQLQVIFKGGQVGRPDFFVKAGETIHSNIH